MEIQSLSVVVPNAKCVNNCAFCVSKMHTDVYKNQMNENHPFFDLYMSDYLKRLEFARHNGCNTVMLTGNSEPQQNRMFLIHFGMFMHMMRDPFQWIEMQTTGVLLDSNYLRFLRNHVGVNLISLSISAPSDEMNYKINGTPEAVINLSMGLKELCSEIKRYDFSLRLSLNLTNQFRTYEDRYDDLFNWAHNLGADQVTFRVLYLDQKDTPQARWIENNSVDYSFIDGIHRYIQTAGTPREMLPYGARRYSVHGMSVVIDDDCMAKKAWTANVYKYLILQPNCKLYSQWDDPASLIF